MDQFEYVMVLVSIIVGLGIAHLLLGVGGIVDRVASGDRPLRSSVAYFSWLGVVFAWSVMFWWWEFKFSGFVAEWTIGLYFFLVIYAVTLFLFIGGMINAMDRGRDEVFTLYMNIGLYFGGLLLLLSWGLAQMFDRLALRESRAAAE